MPLTTNYASSTKHKSNGGGHEKLRSLRLCKVRLGALPAGLAPILQAQMKEAWQAQFKRHLTAQRRWTTYLARGP